MLTGITCYYFALVLFCLSSNILLLGFLDNFSRLCLFVIDTDITM